MRYLTFLLIFATLLGCSTDSAWRKRLFPNNQDRAEAKAHEEQEERQSEHAYDGKIEDEIISEFGAPTKIEPIGSFKVFTYYQDHGITTTVKDSATPIFGSVLEKGTARTVQHYYQQRFYFRNGKVVKWDEDEQ